MELSSRHLRSLVEVCDCGYSVTLAAERLGVAQSAISKRIQHMEEVVGVALFARRGKRLVKLTPAGREILDMARKMLGGFAEIRKVGALHASGKVRAELRLGTTHYQARYVLPEVVRRFRGDYPNIFLSMLQGSPPQLVQMLHENAVDIVICTEQLRADSTFNTEAAFTWNRALIVPPGHALAGLRNIKKKDLAQYPLITYVRGMTGRASFDEEMAQGGARPVVAVAAADADIVKTYVRLGLGAGVIADRAYDPRADSDLVFKSLAHLFSPMTTYIAYRRDRRLAGGADHFLSLFRQLVKDEKEGGGAKTTPPPAG